MYNQWNLYRIFANCPALGYGEERLLRWLKAIVSGQVKSYTREHPRAHGTIVRPIVTLSGLSPSLRLSDAVSNMAGVSADANTCLMRSLTALCLKWRPSDLRQARPWDFAALTCSLHTHTWGEQMFEPRRSPTAIVSEGCRGECRELSWEKIKYY